MKLENLAWIVEAGFQVLRLTENETSAAAEHTYWIVYKFEPCSQKGVESVDFNYLEGVDITEFLKQHVFTTTKTNFVSMFEDFMESESVPNFRMKFSPLMKWKLYTKFSK